MWPNLSISRGSFAFAKILGSLWNAGVEGVCAGSQHAGGFPSLGSSYLSEGKAPVISRRGQKLSPRTQTSGLPCAGWPPRPTGLRLCPQSSDSGSGQGLPTSIFTSTLADFAEGLACWIRLQIPWMCSQFPAQHLERIRSSMNICVSHKSLWIWKVSGDGQESQEEFHSVLHCAGSSQLCQGWEILLIKMYLLVSSWVLGSDWGGHGKEGRREHYKINCF